MNSFHGQNKSNSKSNSNNNNHDDDDNDKDNANESIFCRSQQELIIVTLLHSVI